MSSLKENSHIVYLSLYVIALAVVIFFFTGSKITTTGNVILVSQIPKDHFESLLAVIVVFAIILGVLIDAAIRNRKIKEKKIT